MDETIAALRTIDLFAGLDDSMLQLVATGCNFRRVGGDQVVVAEGEPGQSMFLILEGRVEVTRRNVEGDPVHLAERGQGEAFGEMAVLAGGPRSATVRTLVPCRFLVLERNALLRSMERGPAIAVRIIEALAERLRESDAKRSAHQSVRQRLGSYLLLEAERATGRTERGTKFELGVSRQELAERIGSRRETVSRELANLQAIGAIRVKGKLVLIADPAKLDPARA